MSGSNIVINDPSERTKNQEEIETDREDASEKRKKKVPAFHLENETGIATRQTKDAKKKRPESSTATDDDS